MDLLNCDLGGIAEYRTVQILYGNMVDFSSFIVSLYVSDLHNVQSVQVRCGRVADWRRCRTSAAGRTAVWTLNEYEYKY